MFKAFAADHLAVLNLLVLMILGLYIWRKTIAENRIARNIIRWLLIAALILPEIALQIWYLSAGIWSADRSLPLELCSLTMVLGAYVLITGSRRLYPVLYFAGIGGALQAVLTPSLDYPFPHFRFFHFFIVHAAIILAPLYLTWIRRMRPTWKSIGWTMLFLNAAALAVGLVNWAVGANYMYLMNKPSTPSVLDYLGPHPYYILAEELFALVLFILMQAVFFTVPDIIRHKRRRVQALETPPQANVQETKVSPPN